MTLTTSGTTIDANDHNQLSIFAILDSKAGTHGPLFLYRTVAEALRAFGHALTDEGSTMASHPEDFTLFHLGHFHQQTAEISVLSAKVSLANLLDLQVAINNGQSHPPLAVIKDA